MLSYLFLCSAKDAEGFCGLHFLCSTPMNVNHDKMSIWETLLLGVICTCTLSEYQGLKLFGTLNVCCFLF